MVFNRTVADQCRIDIFVFTIDVKKYVRLMRAERTIHLNRDVIFAKKIISPVFDITGNLITFLFNEIFIVTTPFVEDPV